jgi:putative sporulation protein YyaC
MCEVFSIDSSSITACIKIKDYLLNELQPILNENRPIIFICIGSDRSTGDSLGPLVGYKLKSLSRNNIYVYGTLENPIHAKNLVSMLNEISSNFENPYIIAIDSCLGSLNNIGKIFIQKKPLLPGLALNKQLPAVGEMSITGIVNISGSFEFLVLQNTRLNTVMNLADSISRGIYYFILKSLDKSNSNNISIANLK